MKQCLLILTVLIVTVQAVMSQTPNASRSSGSINFRSISNSRENGRSLSSGQGSINTVTTQEKSSANAGDEEDFLDLGYDNSPSAGKEPIQFPSDDVQQLPPMEPKLTTSKWQKIPLKALLQLDKLGDISSFLKNHVANAKVIKDPATNEIILVDNSGAPLLNSRHDKVIIEPAPQAKTFVVDRTPAVGSARTGSPGPHMSRTSNTLYENGLDITSRLQPQHKASAPPEVCTPEPRSVPVPNTVPPHILQLPKCLRVQRCGGCCLSDLMACEPAETEKVNFTVRHFAYIGQDGSKKDWEFVDEPEIQVEQHTACKCQCIIKPEHCKPHHAYEDCSCVCKNQADFNRCERELNKRWDKDSCVCICRELRDCSSGYYYDLNACSCVKEVEVRTAGRRRHNGR